MFDVLSVVAAEPDYVTYAAGFGITVGLLLFVLGVAFALGAVRRLLDV